MRILASLAILAACEHGQSPAADAPFPFPTDPSVCEIELDAALVRDCADPSECVLVSHDDCCGIVRFGVHASIESEFPTIEADFQRCRACPPLGCNHADQAEDGSVPGVGQAIVATCIANRCTSIVQ